MRIAAKFLMSLVLALLVAWAIRTYVFTVFSVPAGGLPPQLKEGNRVIVNRIDCEVFDRGEVVVYTDSVNCFIGKIAQLPGDTLSLYSGRYVIPMVCCKRCGCKDCRYYLVRTANGAELIHKHQIVGKAYKIF